jgi:serine/threonine-protein kinase
MQAVRSAPETLVGSVIDRRYRIIQHMGSGGVGHVYLAEELLGARARVALKVLRAEHRHVEGLHRRFEREAAAASRVRDPRVLEVYDQGCLPDGLPFFTMELLVGLDLADTLGFTRALAPVRAVRVAAAVAGALAAAHDAGVIHRDIKPENIFLVHAPDGRELPKLLDFGFAWMIGDPGASSVRITGRRTTVGTPEYMPPEQAAGDVPRPTADVYALGIVLYEMLAGRVPFTGDYPTVAEKHATTPPPPLRAHKPDLAISPALSAVVDRALEKQPSHRFASAAEMAQALLATPEGQRMQQAG